MDHPVHCLTSPASVSAAKESVSKSNCALKFHLQLPEPGRVEMQKHKWVNFGASPMYETLRPGWGINPLLPLHFSSVFT